MNAPTEPTPDGTVAPETTLGPFSQAGAVAIPWSATVDALKRTQKFTVCTVRADGRPHVTPLLAIWAFDAMWFVTGEHEQKAKNLARNPRCVLSAGTDTLTGTDHVIEGRAELVTDPAERARGAEAFEQAYGWHLTRADGTWNGMGDAVRAGTVQLYRVRPDVAFTYGNGAVFSQTRYRWT